MNTVQATQDKALKPKAPRAGAHVDSPMEPGLPADPFTQGIEL